MKNRKWISLAVSALLSVTALPTMAFAEEAATETVKEATAKSVKELTEITLNEVAHSIFYAPQYVAIEEGYFAEEGIALTLVTGFGADKVMTALLSGEAEIGFMGSEASIYTYSGGAGDAPVNFAQLTQRAGNFLVAREEMPDFTWADLIGKDVLGGRKGGMPQMVFEYILRQNDIDPSEVQIDQSIDFGSTAAAFSSGKGDRRVRAGCNNTGAGRRRNRGRLARYRFRLCAIHRLLYKIRLSLRAPEDHSGIHKRTATWNGICTFTHAGRNRRSDRATVPGIGS